MRYVIWGSGKRGKWILELLGKEQIIAFVDSDFTKAGQECEGIPILDIETATKLYRNYIYIITPYGYEAEIAHVLEDKGIGNYIEIGYLDRNISMDNFYKDYTWDIPKDICALYGINLFNLLLYKHLEKSIVKIVYLVPEKETNKDLTDMISEEYKVTRIEQLPAQTKIIVPTRECKHTLPEGYNVESFMSILNRGLPIYNDELLRFKNVHKSERCFIVATGPSLRVEDLEILNRHNEITFSMNRIYNIFEKTAWRPDYYVIQDFKAIEDLADEIADLELPYKFVSYRPEAYWENPVARASSIKFKLISEIYKNELPNFSTDISRGIFEGYTVTYACLQIAMYMGFKEIYLLGVDFDYKEDLYSEENHFPGYQSKDKHVRLNQVRPDLVALAYRKARLYSEEQGTKIYNATRGGKLDIFERAEFDALF